MRSKSMALFLLFISSVTPALAATYVVDQDHSSVTFKIKHMFSYTTGEFKKFEGTIEYELAKPENWKAAGSVDVNSLDTNNQKRDQHLLSPEFFDAAKCPAITFKSTGVHEATNDKAKLKGILTMHCIEKPVELDVQILGTGKDPWGNTRAGFSATTKVNRKDFGINWNQTLDTGGLLVGEEVEIHLEIEAIEKAA